LFIKLQNNKPKMSLMSNSLLLILGLALLAYAEKINSQPITTTYDQCPYAQSVSVGNDGTVYIACLYEVMSINPMSGNVTILTSPIECLYPSSVAVGHNGTVYATCRNNVVSISNGTVTNLTTTSQCRHPYNIFVDDDVYASCLGVNGVVKISGKTVSILMDRGQCPELSKVVANTNTGVVYVGCTGVSRGVFSIDDGVIKTLPASLQCSSISGLSVNSRTGAVYISCTDAVNTVFEIDSTGSDFTVLAAYNQCANPGSIFASHNETVYVVCDNGIFSIANKTVTTLTVADQCYYSSLFVDENKGAVYAVCSDVVSGTGKVISITL
jgi:hypothetical protein